MHYAICSLWINLRNNSCIIRLKRREQLILDSINKSDNFIFFIVTMDKVISRTLFSVNRIAALALLFKCGQNYIESQKNDIES